MLYKNGEGYPDYVVGAAICRVEKPPESIINFRKALKLMCTIYHVRILGKVAVIDDKGRHW